MPDPTPVASAVDTILAGLAEVKAAPLTSEEQQAAQLLASLINGLLDKAAKKVEADAAASITTLEAAEDSASKR